MDQKSDGNEISKEVVSIMENIISALKEGWSLGVDADDASTLDTTIEESLLFESDNRNATSLRPLGDRVLAVMPFHAASNAPIFGGSNIDKGSTGKIIQLPGKHSYMQRFCLCPACSSTSSCLSTTRSITYLLLCKSIWSAIFGSQYFGRSTRQQGFASCCSV